MRSSALCAVALALPALARGAPPELVVQTGHTVGVRSIAYSPDGWRLASGDAAGRVLVWDLRSRRLLRALAGHSAGLHGLAFSPDGRRLATAGKDQVARIWDLATGRVVHELPGTEYGCDRSVAFTPAGLVLPTEAGMSLFDPETGRERRVLVGCGFAPAPGGKLYATARGNDIVLVDLSLGRDVRKLRGHTGAIRDLVFSASGDLLASAGFDDTVRVWETSSGRVRRTVRAQYASSASFSPQGETLAVGGSSDLRLVDLRTGKERRIQNTMGEVVRFAPDGRTLAAVRASAVCLVEPVAGRDLACLEARAGDVYTVAFGSGGVLYTGGSELRQWRLDTLRFSRRYYGGARFSLQASGGLLAASAAPTVPEVAVYDTETGATVSTLGTKLKFVKAVAFHPRGATLYVAGMSGDVGLLQAWDAESGRQLWAQSFAGSVQGIAASPDGSRLAIATAEEGRETVHVLDAATRAEVRRLQGTPLLMSMPWDERDLAFMPDASTLLVSSRRNEDAGAYDLTVRAWDLAGGAVARELPGSPWFSLSRDGRRLARPAEPGTVAVEDPSSGVRLLTLAGQSPAYGQPAFSPDGRWVAAPGTDGRVTIWGLDDGRERVSVVAADWQAAAFAQGNVLNRAWGEGSMDAVVATPEGDYLASPDAFRLVAFRAGDRAYSFEQFDLRFNRPDRVLERMGLAPPEIIAAYRRAREKRLQRQGLSEQRVSGEIHAPEVSFVAAPPPAVRSRKLVLRVRARDAKFPLDRLLLSVGGVTVAGSRGMPLGGANAVEKAVEVELSPGPNRITVTAVNARGAEARAEEATVLLDAPEKPPRLFLLAVGVGAYKDARYRLDYPAKDAADLAGFFRALPYSFSEVRTRVLLDGDGTREKILGAREFLAQAGVDDQAVVYVAGHGLLDERLDYWFGTADLDFARPARRGLGYAEVEGLLDGVPARRKLLLMDTCHAGELDKDERRTVADAAGGAVQLRGRALRGIEPFAPAAAKLDVTVLLRQLFADLRRGSGTVVIAAAGGLEFALESGEWKNGAFTYALLEGMRGGRADLDHDGEVRVSELRDFVGARVQELTGGRQRPLARREGIELDFPVF